MKARKMREKLLGRQRRYDNQNQAYQNAWPSV